MRRFRLKFTGAFTAVTLPTGEKDIRRGETVVVNKGELDALQKAVGSGSYPDLTMDDFAVEEIDAPSAEEVIDAPAEDAGSVPEAGNAAEVAPEMVVADEAPAEVVTTSEPEATIEPEPLVTSEPQRSLDDNTAMLLIEAGLDSPEMVAAASDEELLAIKGIGPAKLREIRQAFGPAEASDE